MFYDSPENRKLNTIIESISAVGETIPPYIIINGRRKMDNWFNDDLDPEITIDTSDTGYIFMTTSSLEEIHYSQLLAKSASSRFGAYNVRYSLTSTVHVQF
jgi:hypothetical protein